MDAGAQGVLKVRLGDEARFDNFYLSGSARQIVESLTAPGGGHHLVYLWGARASGRSHLLQALCRSRLAAGAPSRYLPLTERGQFPPDILSGTERQSVVCLDDIDSVAGDGPWERALFNLYNELSGGDGRLVVSAACAPRRLALDLADLRSRLQSGLTFHLAELPDGDKRELLKMRAKGRGMRLGDDAAEYIVRRSGRGLDELMAVLERLDAGTLERRRRLTVPLIKEALGW